MLSSGPDLTQRDTHFDFGLNWADYADEIDEERLEIATKSVKSLVPDLAGKSFLDIGSGSGLFSVAASRLGASRIRAVDIDENSVATTRRVVAKFAPKADFSVKRASVFDLSADKIGQFDVVYSWGVLHHTGDMWRAVEQASQLVAPGGLFVFALYEKSPLCGAWKVEKKLYMNSPEFVQRMICGAYKSAYFSLLFLAGRKPVGGARGVGPDHRAHDWLGGFPYESANAGEVRAHMEPLGFTMLEERTVPVHLAGLFGVGCSEYVYRRGPAKGDA